ncbi:Serine/arginine-rich splicing factor 7 like protein [Argiope bruennichi]|uniref:Serine/arginine-rich splicing factor 7 like protein n=1 Tax=Argiope bruennichi TaxID=94029 RepID=A0A8T0FCX6_ARGBR|nr:Serine/arginine-rich splicing factor 7 like protein [Argiope bruennichi]
MLGERNCRILCGRRVRVELSSGKSRSSYRPPPRYNPDERCYECGERGHYARDCRGPKRGRSRLTQPQCINQLYRSSCIVVISIQQ